MTKVNIFYKTYYNLLDFSSVLCYINHYENQEYQENSGNTMWSLVTLVCGLLSCYLVIYLIGWLWEWFHGYPEDIDTVESISKEEEE